MIHPPKRDESQIRLQGNPLRFRFRPKRFKGSKNAASYQKRIVEEVVVNLTEALSELKASGALFQNITKLSKFLATRLNISDVSLRRNDRYRAMLNEYLVSQPGAASILTQQQQDLNVLNARIKTLQIENSNKAQDIKRLEAALENLDVGVSPVLPSSATSDGALDNDVDDGFVSTANLVLALFERLPGVFVDFERRMIIDQYDLSGNEVVAHEKLAGPFIDWMHSQQMDQA